VGSIWSDRSALQLAFWAVGAQHEARHGAAGTELGCASLTVAMQGDMPPSNNNPLNHDVLRGATSTEASVQERRRGGRWRCEEFHTHRAQDLGGDRADQSARGPRHAPAGARARAVLRRRAPPIEVAACPAGHSALGRDG
jgi:hypothetical protein